MSSPSSEHKAAARPPSFFFILVAISAMGPLALNIFIPSMPGLQREFGISYGVAQLTLTLYLMGMAGCQIVYGPLSDRYGRRPLLLLGLALFVARQRDRRGRAVDRSPGRRPPPAGSRRRIGPRARPRHGARRLQPREIGERHRLRYHGLCRSAHGGAGASAAFSTQSPAGEQASGWLRALAPSPCSCPGACFPRRIITDPRRRLRSAWSRAPVISSPCSAFVAMRMTLAFGSAVFFAFLGGAPHVMVDVLHRSPDRIWPVVCRNLPGLHGRQFPVRPPQRTPRNRPAHSPRHRSDARRRDHVPDRGDLGLAGAGHALRPDGVAAFGNGLTIPNGTAGAISVDARLTGAAAGWSGFTQMACGAAASQLVGSLQDGWPLRALLVHGGGERPQHGSPRTDDATSKAGALRP